MNPNDYLTLFKQTLRDNIASQPFDALCLAETCMQENPLPSYLEEIPKPNLMDSKQYEKDLYRLNEQRYSIFITELNHFLNTHLNLSAAESLLLGMTSNILEHQKITQALKINEAKIKQLEWLLNPYYQNIQKSIDSAKTIKGHLWVLHTTFLLSAIFSPYFLLASLLVYHNAWLKTFASLYHCNPLLLMPGLLFSFPTFIGYHLFLKQKITNLEDTQETIKACQTNVEWKDIQNQSKDIHQISNELQACKQKDETLRRQAQDIWLKVHQLNQEIKKDTAVESYLDQNRFFKLVGNDVPMDSIEAIMAHHLKAGQ